MFIDIIESDSGRNKDGQDTDVRRIAAAIREVATLNATIEEKVWLGWLAAAVCSFAALEIVMPIKLCHVIRKHLRIHPQRPGHRIAGTGLVLAAGWAVAHLLDEHHADRVRG